jgi:hypothetical protein
VSLSLLEFGQLRTKPIKGEKYRICWRKDGMLKPKFDDKVSIALSNEDAKGVWKVNVQLLTDEVRKDLKGSLQDSSTFEIR